MGSTSFAPVHFSLSAVKQVRKNLGVAVKKEFVKLGQAIDAFIVIRYFSLSMEVHTC